MLSFREFLKESLLLESAREWKFWYNLDSGTLFDFEEGYHHMPWAYKHPKELHLSPAQFKDVARRSSKGTDSAYTDGLVLENNIRIVMTDYELMFDLEDETGKYFQAMQDALHKLPLNKILADDEDDFNTSNQEPADIRVYISFPLKARDASIKTNLEKLFSAKGFAWLRAR